MRQRFPAFALTALALLFLAIPANAYIQAEISMKQVLAQTQFIFTAKVESFDADKRTAVFRVDEHLKGRRRSRSCTWLLLPTRKPRVPGQGRMHLRHWWYRRWLLLWQN